MTLGSHQTTIGKSQVHLTPRSILDPLGVFDLDPCASDPRPWDCATVNYTEVDDGLARPWHGRVWLNPPFHRYQIADWIARMARHDRGVLLVHARTDTEWFQQVWRNAAGILFLAGRVIFCKPDGTPQTIANPRSKHYGKAANSGAPVVLAAFGAPELDVIASCGLAGALVPLVFPRGVLVQALQDLTWRSAVTDFLARQGRPVAVADLYRAFADHPKTKSNPHWRAKLRQTLQRGRDSDFVHHGPGQWSAA